MLYIQHTLQFTEMTIQPLKGQQSYPSEKSLIEWKEHVCIHLAWYLFTLDSYNTEPYCSMIRMVGMYEYYWYITRWPNTKILCPGNHILYPVQNWHWLSGCCNFIFSQCIWITCLQIKKNSKYDSTYPHVAVFLTNSGVTILYF